MHTEVLKDNVSLSLRVKELEGLLSLQKQKLDILSSTIKLFSHFIPQVYEKFEAELSEIHESELEFLDRIKVESKTL